MERKYKKFIAVFTSIMLLISLLSESVVIVKADSNSFVELEPYQTDNAIVCTKENGKKMMMMGEEFDEGVYTDNSAGSMSAQYNLGKRYNTLTFTVGHIDNERGNSRTLTVSLDGEEVKEIPLYQTMPNQTETIDVNGAAQVSFYVNGQGSNYYDSAVFGIVNVHGILSNNYTEPEVNGLISLSPYQSSNAIVCTWNNDKSFKMMGEEFSEGFYTDNSASSMSAQYNLGKKYNTLRFTVGHIDNERGNNRTLTVSLDGEEVKKIPLYRTMPNQTETIDVNGATQVSFYVNGQGSNYYDSAIFGIANICAEPLDGQVVPISRIDLDISDILMEIGEERLLIANVFPENAYDKTLIWKSENPEIATVSQDGRVEAVTEGITTITVMGGNGITASCIVTVRSTSTDEIEFSIDPFTEGTIHSLLEISGYIRIRREGEIDGSLLEDLEREIGNIQWTSSDSSVVTVKSYRVTKISEQGWAEIKISLEPKKRGKATIIGITQSGLEAVGQIEITGAYIVQRVERYTSDDLYAQYDAIKNSNYSMEKQCQKFHELFSNYGFSDAKEGISYLSETTAERYAYLMLTTDECYTASQFLYDLNHTQKGKAMRAALVADGLIFNSEWKTWTDPLSLSASMGEFPGVKKYKEMLYDYMQAQSKKVECADYVKKVTDLTDNVVDVTKAQILHEVNNANDSTKVLDVLRKYGDVLFTSDNNEGTIKYTISENSGFGKFAKAEGYASTGISIASTAIEDVMGFIQLDSKLKAYQENKDFLNEVIRSADDLPSEMRYAAYLIREEMEAGVGANIEDLALDIVKIGKLTENSFTEILNGYGISAPGALMNFLGQLDVGVWFSNQIINMGSVVKKEAYVEGYAYLAKHFTKLLQQNKQAFLNNRTEENAWNFYYTYHTLYQIRKKGEESYLAMCNVKGLAAGLAKKSINYELKEKVVNNILEFWKNAVNLRFQREWRFQNLFPTIQNL